MCIKVLGFSILSFISVGISVKEKKEDENELNKNFNMIFTQDRFFNATVILHSRVMFYFRKDKQKF